MAKPKLDEWLDTFSRMDAETRTSYLQALYGADYALRRQEAPKPGPKPRSKAETIAGILAMGELGERGAEDFAKRKATAELPLLASAINAAEAEGL